MRMILQALSAFVVTLLAVPLARAAAHRLGLLDRPNARSSHVVVTPRAGGVALALGLLAALALTPVEAFGRRELLGWLAGGLIVAGLGLLDDRYGLSPWPRLAGQLLAGGVVVSLTHGLPRLPLPAPLDLGLAPFGHALALLWVVAVVNFYNFMDGIDGLAGAQGLITAAVLGLALGSQHLLLAGLAVSLAAACAAFLVFNWPPASIFLGDAGSGLVGYTLATLPLLIPEERRSEAVALTGASLFFFLADATYCLARRIRRGRRWFEAHREHLYQRWVWTGAGHAVVTSCLAAAALVTSGIALLGWQRRQAAWTWAALLLGTAGTAAEAALVSRRERRLGLAE